MRLSSIAIKRIVGTLVITTLLSGMGIYFLFALSVDLLPKITYPIIRIRIAYPGASPEEIETNVTRRVESSIAAAEDAVKVVSTVTEGSSRTDVFFDYGKDMEAALNDVRARMDRIRDLPDEIESPVVFKADPTQLPIFDIAMFSDIRDDIELTRWADKELIELFTGIEGLASVTVSGGKNREVRVVFDPAKLNQYELSESKIISRLAQENIDTPGGYITQGNRELTVRLASKFRDLTDIEKVIVENREGQAIKLGDVAKVIDSHADQRVMMRVNQKPSVVISFLKQPNANTVAVCDAIQKKIAELKTKGLIAEDIKTAVINDQSYYINNSIKSVSEALLYGAGLATIVVFLFLGSIIRTIIVAIAVPVSLMVTFLFMYLLGMNINMISLGGLMLGVGMLLDNSIVVLENITRYQKITTDRHKAAEDASSEIGSAVIASTLTNLASVAPFFLIGGAAVLLFRDIIITISIAVIASLLTALTVVPALAARLTKYSGKREKMGDRINNKAADMYSAMLKKVLKFRWFVVSLLVISSIVCYYSINPQTGEFLPQTDDGKATISVKLPDATAIHITDALAEKIEKALIEKYKDIDVLYSSVGGFWFAGGVSSYSNQIRFNIQLVDKNIRKKPTADFVKSLKPFLTKMMPKDAELKITRPRIRGMRIGSADESFEIKIFGPEISKLQQYSDDMISRLSSVEGLVNLDTSLNLSRPEIHITFDRKRLSDYGLSAASVGETVKANLTGVVATRFTDPKYEEDFDIRVIYQREMFSDIKKMRSMLIPTNSGMSVTLGDIASITSAFGPAEIERENRSRLVRVLGDAQGVSVGQVTESAKKILQNFKLDEQYRFEIAGEAESIAESNRTLMIAALMALFLVFGIMAVQFESLKDPLVIMFTVPFAVIGAVLALAMTGTAFSAVVFLGIILLIGIAVNNGIVMVNYFGVLRSEYGKTIYEAVMEGAPTRLRPVLMTSITTIAGMIPISLGFGEGSEMLAPLGITVIGGLMMATVLTLFVVPSIYMIFNNSNRDRA